MCNGDSTVLWGARSSYYTISLSLSPSAGQQNCSAACQIGRRKTVGDKKHKHTSSIFEDGRSSRHTSCSDVTTWVWWLTTGKTPYLNPLIISTAPVVSPNVHQPWTFHNSTWMLSWQSCKELARWLLKSPPCLVVVSLVENVTLQFSFHRMGDATTLLGIWTTLD